MTNYYHVLGVSPNACEDEIKQAFRRKAAVSHPDRGGSHEAMMLANEAWHILSNGSLRKRHDEALNNASNAAAQAAAKQDAAKARSQASQYPKDSNDIDLWLDRLFARCTAAGFGTYRSAWMVFPTAGNSLIGWVMIFSGAFTGGYLVGGPLIESGVLNGLPRILQLVFFSMPIMIGAWFGQLINVFIFGLAAISSQNPRQDSDNERSSEPTGSEIIRCNDCKQKMRVPTKTWRITVTCPTCGCKFDYPHISTTALTSTTINGMAVTSMVLGILSLALCIFYGFFTIILAPLGIIFGHIARGQIRSGRYSSPSSGFALTGLICSYIGLGLIALLTTMILVNEFQSI